MLTQLSASFALLLTLAAQDASTLRVRVLLVDPSGVATAVPRLLLLVSDNPPADEPRRVRTSAEGTVDLNLAPGSYTVELEEPISFRGKAYTWTQIVEVVAGRQTVLDLTADNAEAADSARISADSATLLAAWRDSVVEIWTPIRHASGFVIDSARGLIATSHHALGDATSVEVQFSAGRERFKVPGRVIVSERDPGAAVVWVDPETLQSTRAIDPGCTAGSFPQANYKDLVATITASMFAGKEISDGSVSKSTPQAIFSDMRVGSDSAGGPVFAQSGALLGISAIDDKAELRRWNETWVVPAERLCAVIATAVKKTADGAPPRGTRLPLEPIPATAPVVVAKDAGAAKPAKPTVTTVPASDFDITLLAPKHVRSSDLNPIDVRTNFGTWSEYVRDADQVIFVRVSPQFEESLWKMLARGAAATQGVQLPPLRSFSSNFLRLGAYCGESEVTPIHPFIIEHAVPNRSPIREGLYVFEAGAFGPHCSSIRFSMFSEKDPQRADTKVIDPKLFEQLAKP
jgi:S1-C subfamily serine protease